MSRIFPQMRRLAACVASLALASVVAAGLLPSQSARAVEEDLSPQSVLSPLAGPDATAEGGKTPAQAVAALETGSDLGSDLGGFSAVQLSAYADAVLAVQALDRAWSGRIDWAGSEEEAEALTARAAEEMVAAIEAQGLSLRDYNTITVSVAKNRHLHERITGLLTRERQSAAR
jgi:hypothetical protein